VSKDEVTECSLRADPTELILVLRIDLYSQAHGKNKRSHARNEPGQEGVEWEGSHQAAVDELRDAGQKDVQQIGVHDLQLLRGGGHVVVVETLHDRL